MADQTPIAGSTGRDALAHRSARLVLPAAAVIMAALITACASGGHNAANSLSSAPTAAPPTGSASPSTITAGLLEVLQPTATVTNTQLAELGRYATKLLTEEGITNDVFRRGRDVVVAVPTGTAIANLTGLAAGPWRPVPQSVQTFSSVGWGGAELVTSDGVFGEVPLDGTDATGAQARAEAAGQKLSSGGTVVVMQNQETGQKTLGLELEGTPMSTSETDQLVSALESVVSAAVPPNDIAVNTLGPVGTPLSFSGTDVQLLFRPVDCELPAYSPASASQIAPPLTVGPTTCALSNPASMPSTPASSDTAGLSVVLPIDKSAYGTNAQFRFVLGPADLTGADISGANTSQSPSSGHWTVNLTLTSDGNSAFNHIAAARYACYQQNQSNPPPCSLEAFDLDGEVESAPTFQAVSFNGNIVLANSFSHAQAVDIANEINAGES